MTAPYDAGGDVLFEVERPAPITLADRFIFPPFSLLDRRTGEWQDRKRAWLSMGIQSEVGRGDDLLFGDKGSRTDFVSEAISAIGATSVFDPVICELAYRWFTATGDHVLDPFAGGSVRGIAAATLARHYTGVDLRAEQVLANADQAHLVPAGCPAPQWLCGNSAQLDEVLPAGAEYDLVFSCPPYADLEVYSDLPEDLSTMPYDEFRAAHAEVIRAACSRLRDDRFAVWVISDVRDKRGAYRGLIGHTVEAFQAAGLAFYNDAILMDPVGTARLRAGGLFTRTRKLSRMHQHFLVFVKGNAKRAAARCSEVVAP